VRHGTKLLAEVASRFSAQAALLPLFPRRPLSTSTRSYLLHRPITRFFPEPPTAIQIVHIFGPALSMILSRVLYDHHVLYATDVHEWQTATSHA